MKKILFILVLLGLLYGGASAQFVEKRITGGTIMKDSSNYTTWNKKQIFHNGAILKGGVDFTNATITGLPSYLKKTGDTSSGRMYLQGLTRIDTLTGIAVNPGVTHAISFYPTNSTMFLHSNGDIGWKYNRGFWFSTNTSISISFLLDNKGRTVIGAPQTYGVDSAQLHVFPDFAVTSGNGVARNLVNFYSNRTGTGTGTRGFGLKMPDSQDSVYFSGLGGRTEVYNFLGKLLYNGLEVATLENLTPSSSSDTGTKGMMRYDSDFLYVCTATNTWKRVAISTW